MTLRWKKKSCDLARSRNFNQSLFAENIWKCPARHQGAQTVPPGPHSKCHLQFMGSGGIQKVMFKGVGVVVGGQKKGWRRERESFRFVS